MRWMPLSIQPVAFLVLDRLIRLVGGYNRPNAEQDSARRIIAILSRPPNIDMPTLTTRKSISHGTIGTLTIDHEHRAGQCQIRLEHRPGEKYKRL
ncbi:hypothetical protein BDV19DRAFT_315193 [Aspergillus venezuelensis]